MQGHLFTYVLNIVYEFNKRLYDRYIICTKYMRSMFQRGHGDIFMPILDIVSFVFGVTCSVIALVSFLLMVGVEFQRLEKCGG